MKRLQFIALLFAAKFALAQFTPALIQNDSYWNDGKAEFSMYGAELIRDGAARTCEVFHILRRENGSLKMNQIMTVPIGLKVQQQMLSMWWRVDNARLQKFSLTSADISENVYKEANRGETDFVYEYRGSNATKDNVSIPPNGYFYDELPWLVRTIDFNEPNEFEIQLAGGVMNSRKDNVAFQPAKVSFTLPNERFIEVKVNDDRFTLDRGFPHLLREWKAGDGSHLKLKRNLKVDYWNYTKPGDRERALNNPMLRLPD